MFHQNARALGALLLVFLLTLMACRTAVAGRAERATPPAAAQSTGKVKTMNQDPLDIQLTAEPRHFPFGEIDRFKLSVEATNRGQETIDPQLYLTRLLVNGEDSMDFSLAISNGLREENWYALPPGETASITWSSMGPSLFPGPGEYTLVLQYQGQQLDPVTVEVADR